MRKRISIPMLAILLIASAVQASVHGEVLDATSSARLGSVTVTLASSGVAIMTDSQGAFDFGLSGTGTSVRSIRPTSVRIRGNQLLVPQGIRAELFDLKGRAILQAVGSIDLRGLSSGIYRGRADGARFKLVRAGTGSYLSLPSTDELLTRGVAYRAMAQSDTLRFRGKGYPELKIAIESVDTMVVAKLVFSAEQLAFDSAESVLNLALSQSPVDTLGLDRAGALFRSYLKKWPSGLEPDNARWKLGYIEYRRNRYTSGAALLAGVRDSFPASGWRINADFYLGRCQYELGLVDSTQYSVAMTTFNLYLAKWPDGVLSDNASYYIGRCYHQMHDFDNAIAAYRGTETRYPNGTMIDAGLYYTGVAFYDKKLYDSTLAIEASFPARFPNSVYLDNALYYHAKALYRQASLTVAAAELDQVIAWVPVSNLLDYAIYYRLRIRLDLGDCAGAKPLVQRLRKDFPLSTATTLADAYAAKLSCTVP